MLEPPPPAFMYLTFTPAMDGFKARRQAISELGIPAWEFRSSDPYVRRQAEDAIAGRTERIMLHDRSERANAAHAAALQEFSDAWDAKQKEARKGLDETLQKIMNGELKLP